MPRTRWHAILQFCWRHGHSMGDLLRVGYQEQEACHALDFSSLCTFSMPVHFSTKTKAHILHIYLLKMLLGVRSTNTHCLLREIGQIDAFAFLLVLLCCSLLEQPADN